MRSMAFASNLSACSAISIIRPPVYMYCNTKDIRFQAELSKPRLRCMLNERSSGKRMTPDTASHWHPSTGTLFSECHPERDSGAPGILILEPGYPISGFPGVLISGVSDIQLGFLVSGFRASVLRNSFPDHPFREIDRCSQSGCGCPFA